MIDEHLDVEDGYKGISRFTCYRPSYIVDEWEDKKIIREWKILTEKEDYFAFLVYINKIFKEKEQLTHDATVLIHSNQEYREENERLKKDVEYWKQVASQYRNELNVFEHCKKHKTECKDIYWRGD